MNNTTFDNIDMRKLGVELQRARKRKGMTQEDAAKVINVSRTTITAIESGERRIKAGELIQLSEAYGCPVHDLVRERPDIEAFKAQFRGPFIRTEHDDREIEPSILELEDLCRNYFELEVITQDKLIRRYPEPYNTRGSSFEATAESIALEERQRFGLGDRPIENVRRLLEKEVGLRIFYIEMPRKFSEIYGYSEELGGCLALNIVHPDERRRWSLAHGYFHFLTTRYKPEVNVEGKYQRQPESEKFADAFARYFLMPTASLTRKVSELQRNSAVTPTALLSLADEYGVSFEALTLRLESMRLLPSGTWNKMKGIIKVRAAQQQLGLDNRPEDTHKLPLRYRDLAFEAFRIGAISEAQFAHLLEIDRNEARHVAQVLAMKEDELTDDGAFHITDQSVD